MRILNIGFDKTLVGGSGFGDAPQRHLEYGKHVQSIDIIVYTTKDEFLFSPYKIAENVTGYPTNSSNKIGFLFDAYRIAKQIYQKYHIDIIVAQDPHGAGLVSCFLKNKFKSKLQINFHGDFWKNTRWVHERWYNFIYLLISKFTIPRADAIRAVSQGIKDKLVRTGIPEGKIRVIPTPVDVNRFAKYEGTIQSDKKIILMVGRPDPVKGYDVLKKAKDIISRSRSDVEFWIIGNNKIDWADKVLSSVDSHDLPKYYHTAYLVTLPSYSESFGKVLIEANASGRPVVATATTGAREIVRDGYNGFLVPIGDHKALAEKIIYLLEHEDIAKQMGEQGQKLVLEKFKPSTAKIIMLWQDILKS